MNVCDFPVFNDREKAFKISWNKTNPRMNVHTRPENETGSKQKTGMCCVM